MPEDNNCEKCVMSPWKLFDRIYRITSIERRIIVILGHWQAEISDPGYWHVRTDSDIFSILVVNLQSRGNYQCLCETAGINYYKRTGRGNSPMRSQRAACSTNVDLFDFLGCRHHDLDVSNCGHLLHDNNPTGQGLPHVCLSR